MKYSGSYPSLSRGVSQQEPEVRLDGQHGEQVNLLTDPVIGLCRRRGTILQSSWPVNSVARLDQIYAGDPTGLAKAREYLGTWRRLEWVTEGEEYLVLYPTQAMPVQLYSLAIRGPLIFRKESAAGRALGYVKLAGIADEPQVTASFKGFSAACQIGRYLMLAPNNTPFPVSTETDYVANTSQYAVVAVRGGNYSRTYKVIFRVGGTSYLGMYTTPSSAYSGTLDTSDILYSDPEYVKKVNDRVNAYNSAVTAWITTAAHQIRPSYIASQLVNSLYSSGLPAGTAGAVDGGIIVGLAGLTGVEVDDGGDGTALRATHMTVKEPALLSDFHLHGKVVEVKGTDSAPAYYLRAQSTSGTATWGPVRWVEAQRYGSDLTVNAPFMLIGQRSSDGVCFARMSPAAMNSVVGGDLPVWNWRKVGDRDTSAQPYFFGRQISYLGMFQDRLLVGAGGVLNMSETANYFQFWRTTTLTVPDDDPVEAFAIGAEEDTIRHSVLFDRSLVLFGDNQQYSLDGTNPVTPATTVIVQSSATEDATDTPPQASGDLVFFAKRREQYTTLYQIEVGNVQDTSNSSELGLQLSTYLPGKPSQILPLTTPNAVLVRTSEKPNSIYVFRYIDQNRQRVLDSWSRFDYRPEFGQIIGMSTHKDQVYIVVYREADGANGSRGHVAVELQSMLSSYGGYPHLDSLRNVEYHTQGPAHREWHNQTFLSLAVGQGSAVGALMGMKVAPSSMPAFYAGMAQIGSPNPAHSFVGLPFDSYVEMTSPFRRTQDGRAMVGGRLTVSRLHVKYKDTSGFYVDVRQRRATRTQDFQGRILGEADNLVGVIPVGAGEQMAPIGADSREYTATLRSKSWLPMTLSAVRYTGQWFMNNRGS